MATGAVTQIDTTYLNQLKGQLQGVLNDVSAQLKGTGYPVPVDQNFAVLPGTGNFSAGAALNTALKAMGGSVRDQLTWLHKVLTDMINEITTTVNSFTGTESLNTDSVDQLMSDFQSTINDLNSPPSGSGSSNTPTGTSNTPAASGK